MPALKEPIHVEIKDDPREEEKQAPQLQAIQEEIVQFADPKPSRALVATPSQQEKLRYTPSRVMSQASQRVGKGTPARSVKQKRKDSLRMALAAIKNKVPEEGRQIFKDGSKVNDNEIEPFEDHDALMRKAGKIIIYFSPPFVPALEDLKKQKVIEKWDEFIAHFHPSYWSCLHGVPFRWQNGQKVWMHLLVLITTPEIDDIPRHFAWVRVSSIVDNLSPIYRIALFSYLRHRHAELGKKFDIP
jgi:hypothetical protein